MPIGGSGAGDVRRRESQGGRYYDDRQRDQPPPPPFRGGGGGYRANGITGPELTNRRAERDASTLSIWPRSPERSFEELTAREAKDRKKKHKKSSRRDKKHKSSSSSRKHRKRRHSDSESDDSSSSDSDDSDDSRERRRRRKRRDEREKRTRRGADRSPTPEKYRERSARVEPEDEEEDAWVVKDASSAAAPQMSIIGSADGATSARGAALAGALARVEDDDEEEEDVGPQLPVEQRPGGSHAIKYDSKAYVPLLSPSNRTFRADPFLQLRQYATGRRRSNGSVRGGRATYPTTR